MQITRDETRQAMAAALEPGDDVLVHAALSPLGQFEPDIDVIIEALLDAVGPRTDEYTQAYHSHLDDTATITRLLENDGKIMMLGIGYEKCTLYHLSEERHNTPYNFYKEFNGVLTREDGGTEPISQRYFVRRDMTVKKDPSIAGSMLEERGQMTCVPLGRGVLRVFRARDFDACCMDALTADPNAFLAKNSDPA